MTSQTQASTGKGKKKNKEMKVSLYEFNQIDTPVGHSVVNVKVGTGLDWAATMANYDDQSVDTKQIIVPSAPRSHRGPDVDFDSLPDEGPFKVSLFNLPLSVEDRDISDRFFQSLKIISIEQGKASTTVELGTKDDLYNALCKDGVHYKGKLINVCLYGQQPQQTSYNSGGYGSRGGYGDRYDRYGSDGRYNDRQSNSYGHARNDRYGDKPGFTRDSYNNSGAPPMRQGMGSYNSYNRNDGTYGDRFNDRGNFRDRDNRSNQMSNVPDEPQRDESKNWRDRPNPPPQNQPAYNNHGSRNLYSRQESHHQHYQQPSHQQQYRSDPHYQPRFNNQQSNNSHHSYSSQDHQSDTRPPPAPESRPKLQLKPRTLPRDNNEPSKINTDIFGLAKPSNKPYEKMMEVEEKLKSVTIKDKVIVNEQPSKPDPTSSSQPAPTAPPS